VTLCQIFSKRFLNGKGDMGGASPLFTLRKPWPQNGLSEVPERPVGPGVGEPSVLPSDRHSGYPEGNAVGGEGCGVSGYGGGPATGEGYLTGRGGGWGGCSGGGAEPPAEAP